MSSYQDYLNQIEELKRKAEDARKQELASAISEIKKMMAQFGITGEDLGFTSKRKGKARASAAAAYRDPVSGKTWSGRGRRPGWVADLEKAGKKLEDCRIA
jgi:DNA-binding protein H-NS